MKNFFYLTITLVVIIYLAINLLLGTDKLKSVKQKFSVETKTKIKKNFFPFSYINDLNEVISGNEDLIGYYRGFIYYYDLAIKNSLEDLNLIKSKKVSVLENSTLSLYSFKKNKIKRGTNLIEPGSGYLDYKDGILFFVSSIGIFGYSDLSNNDQIIFKQIKNNIEEHATAEMLRKDVWFSIKDLKIINEKVYISFTNEIKENCWNVSVISADLNFEELNFKKVFANSECVSSINPLDKQFNAHQSGGRILNYDDSHILLTHGDFRSRGRAQSLESQFGKVLKINLTTGKYELATMGHRNPGGFFYDKINKFYLLTENGPLGGDEINIINFKKNKLPNYGWPMASYGEHYKNVPDEIKKKYPLLKSHKDHGFIEPAIWFTPAVGTSEIIQIGNRKYMLATLKEESFFTFELDESNQVVNLQKQKVGERIRDLAYNEKDVFLFFETTSSIGIIKNFININ